MKSPLEALILENEMLQDQLAEANKYFVGFNLCPNVSFSSHITNGQIICEESEVLGYLMKFIKGGNICLQIGTGACVTTIPLHAVNILINPYTQISMNYSNNSLVLVMKINDIDLLKTIPIDGVDSVFIFDHLFNLSEKEGKELLDQAKRAAKKQVVVSNIHPDHLNLNHRIRSLQPHVIHQHSIWDSNSFEDAITFKFIATNNPNKIEQKSEGFFALISSEKKAVDSRDCSSKSSRLILLTQSLPEDFQSHKEDLIIGDIQFWDTESVKSKNFIPMYLEVLVKNLHLPKYLLRKVITNYSLLEAYLNTYVEIIPIGYKSSLILEKIRSNQNTD